MFINSKTIMCGVIGDPIDHSLSPVMHNAGYKKQKLNFIYTAFCVKDIENAVKGIKALGIRGVSITLPHKISIIQFLDNVDETAQRIGAVNTVINNNGILTGYNTDSSGAIRALEEVISLENKKIVLIGAGGAARAIAYGLSLKNCYLTIVNRNKEKGQSLAREFGALFEDTNNLSIIQKNDILIHATPTGMNTNTDSLIPKDVLHKNLVVFDIVYNPKETKLIKDAKEKGCKIVYGYKMLLHQAALQFELFTGHNAPITVMEQALLEGLKSL